MVNGVQKHFVFAIQSRLHRDRRGKLRTNHSYARYEAWRPYIAAADIVTLVARVSPEVSEKGFLVEGDGLNVLEVPYYRGPREMIVKYGQLKRFIRLHLSDTSAVFGGRVPNLLSTVLQSHAKSRGRPFLVQVVGDPAEILKANVYGRFGKLLAPVAGMMLRRSVRRADASIFVTRRSLQDRYPYREGTPMLVRSNVELSDESFVSSPRDYQEDPFRQPIRLVTAGSQDQTYKGHDILIKAVALLKTVRVPVVATIIGSGIYHRSLVDLARSLQVESLINFRGHLSSPREVADEVRQSDIFVLPSRTEGLPRVLIEAMASGVACVGSKAGGIVELLPPELLFDIDDVQGLATLIRRLVNCPEEASRHAEELWREAATIRDSYSGDDLLRTFLIDLFRTVSNGDTKK